MSNVRSLNLGDAMLQRGKSPAQAADNNTPPVTQPVNEMAMVLTLDQLRPNPDNPRKGRNPRFEEIKASVRVARRNFSHRNALNYAPQQTSEKPVLRTVQIKTPRSLSHSNDEAGNLR